MLPTKFPTRRTPPRPGIGRIASVSALLLLSACAIQVDETARPVPERERGIIGEQVTGDEAAGSNRIFLIAPQTGDGDTRLRSVRRNVVSDPEEIFRTLIAGPNDTERESGLVSFLPDGIELQSARLRARTLTVSVNDVFDGLTPEALRLAVAQLVATANEIEGVENLLLQIDGVNSSWPLGDGQNTDRRLTIYDYPGVVESSQPPYPAIPTANS